MCNLFIMKVKLVSLLLLFFAFTLSSFTIEKASFSVNFNENRVTYYGMEYELVEVSCKIKFDHRVISYRCIDNNDGYPRCIIFHLYDYNNGRRRIVLGHYAN